MQAGEEAAQREWCRVQAAAEEQGHERAEGVGLDWIQRAVRRKEAGRQTCAPSLPLSFSVAVGGLDSQYSRKPALLPVEEEPGSRIFQHRQAVAAL